MRQERHVGYEIKALSNLLRRKVLEMTGSTDGDDFTEMQVKLLGFLCHNRDQEVCQKDIEEAFYIRRSTASRLLKRLESQGFVIRQTVERDARLKRDHHAQGGCTLPGHYGTDQQRGESADPGPQSSGGGAISQYRGKTEAKSDVSRPKDGLQTCQDGESGL